MQDRIQHHTRDIFLLLARLWQRLLQWAHLGLIGLQKLVTRMQAIKLPRIPLSPFQWIMLVYAAFALAYLVATPIFEASDEIWHFGMVDYIIQRHDLPVQTLASRMTPYRQEGSQPPLYYALSAVVASRFDLSDLDTYDQYNPHAQTGVPGSYGNKNMMLRDQPVAPVRGTAAAVYALRLASLLMGLGTIWAVYQCGRLVSPQRPVVGLVAAAITAFNPMFLFIATSVNNDNLVILLNSVAIYYMLLTLRDGFKPGRSLLIALLIALGALTKLSALVLVPVIAIAALWVAYKRRDWRGLVTLGVMMLSAWALLAGWWYVRNLILYGELFGSSTMAAVAGMRETPFTLGTALSEFEGFRRFYWGVFGAANIQIGDLFYALVDFVVLTSMFGLMFLLAQLAAIKDFRFAREELSRLLFLLGVLLAGMIAFFLWTAQTYATQGRLLFPFFAAISPLLAAGFIEVVWWFLFFLSPTDRSFVQAGQAVAPEILSQGAAWPVRVLGFAALLIPFATIMPQYVPPSTVDRLPDDAIHVYARYDDIELVGYRYLDRRYYPGEPVRLTLYWHVLRQSPVDYSLSLALVDDVGGAIGKIDSYPGAGTLRTTTWQPDKIYEDPYVVQLNPFLEGRFPFRVQVGWWNFNTIKTILPADENQKTLPAVLLNVGAVVSVEAKEDITGVLRYDSSGREPIQFRLSDQDLPLIQLMGFSFDRKTSLVKLRWQAKGAMEKDYHAFAHIVRSADQPPIGQADIAPQLPTHYWRYDEQFLTLHPIQYQEALPAGNYELRVGWYDPETFKRLILPRPADALPDAATPDSYRLFSFTVDNEGKFVSTDLDELEKLLKLEKPVATAEATAEATSDATLGGTGEPASAATQDGTSAASMGTAEVTAQAAPAATLAPALATQEATVAVTVSP